MDFKRIQRVVLALLLLGAFVLVAPRVITGLYAQSRLWSLEEAPPSRVAIVFGARVYADGRVSPVLRERVETAVELYFAGKVDKLLMSGDNRFVDYDEPGAMQKFALSLGVPGEDIVLDYAGRRTYDTCYRARDIFKVDQAVLVTQQYHLPRAIYLCNSLGLAAIGVPAQNTLPPLALWSLLANIRESLATVAALWDVYVIHPRPVLGQPEPIFPSQSQ